MRLLIFTQAIDTEDQVLGFFHRWAEEFSKQFSEIKIICLKKGNYNLPKNVEVFSLGKERGPSRLKYVFNTYRYLWKLRGQYDGVFVHMNEEYVILAGLLWRLLGKKVVLWRNFKTGSWMTPIASRLANIVCYTSPDSFTARYANSVEMPVGIDTGYFVPNPAIQKKDGVLFLGRLDRVKNVDIFVEALSQVRVPFEAHNYGSPTGSDPEYEAKIKSLAAQVPNLTLHSGVSNDATKGLYQSHAVYVNLTPSGSFDKTILEAMACGAVVVCANAALHEVLPDKLIVEPTVNETARGIEESLKMGGEEKSQLIMAGLKYVEEKHSLKLLGRKLSELFVEGKKIKVLFGINDLGIGGAERQTVELIKRLDKNRFESHLLTLSPNPKENFIEELRGYAEVHQINFTGYLNLNAWWKTFELLRALKPDVVVSNLILSNTILRVLKPFMGFTVIACEHNTYVDKTWAQKILDNILARFTYRIVAVSPTVKDFTAKQEHLSEEKFVVIENGVDIKSFQNKLKKTKSQALLKKEFGFAKDLVILNVGRLMPQKNHSLLIEGFAIFHQKVSQSKLVIAGEGWMRPALEEKVRSLGLGDSVTFFGVRRDIEAFYKMADLFVLTSEIEGFALVGIEAMAAGLPVVSTKVAGPDRYIEEGKNGFFIENSTAEAVSRAIEKAAAANFTQLKRGALETAERYDMSRNVLAYEDLIEKAAKLRHGR